MPTLFGTHAYIVVSTWYNPCLRRRHVIDDRAFIGV